MTNAQLKRRLDKLAKDINKLNAELELQYGAGAHLYFESAGSIHAMQPETIRAMRRDETISERQAGIIASSDWCQFDCGAW